MTYRINVKQDYKAEIIWEPAHYRRLRVWRRVIVMGLCAIVTFIGYAHYNRNETAASWSVPGGVMAAYPVLETPAERQFSPEPLSVQEASQESPSPQSPSSNQASAAPVDEPVVTLKSPMRSAAAAIVMPAEAAMQPPDNPGQQSADDLEREAEAEILSEDPVSTEVTDESARPDWHIITVDNGDSMARIFKRLGLSPRQLHEIMQLGEVTQSLQDLKPGQELLFDIDAEGEKTMLQALQYDPDSLHQVTVQRTDNGYEAELAKAELTTKVRAASATIDSSLYLAGKKAGLNDNMIMQLITLYGWDIDFVQDIQRGDHFNVIFQETYRDGTLVQAGPILAAEFANKDRTLRAVRYARPDGGADYYAEDGRSMRKAFIRNPLDVFRISSHFNLKRKHPVLNRIRAHKGTDYAAPTGTPVKASGNGKIVHIGRKGGYGNAIVLEHGGRYSTLYGHLSRFAKGLKSGSRVRQGQVIGYVGATGLATGPHLHYEFRINGVHKNPLTVDLPKAESIPDKLLADFKQNTRPLLAGLQELEQYDGELQVADYEIDRKILLALREKAEQQVAH